MGMTFLMNFSKRLAIFTLFWYNFSKVGRIPTK